MIKSKQGRLLLLSNRLPVTVTKQAGKIDYQQSIGGLATGLRSLKRANEILWLGWCGIPSDKLSKHERVEVENTLIEQYASKTIFLSKHNIENYYEGFCNNTIWPLFHYFPHYVKYDEIFYQEYVKVNRLFCNGVLEVAQPGDIIWIQDYQLMLLPDMLREKLPKAQIGFFLHIPFPSFEVFRVLPWRKELLKGLLGADLIGYHIYDYVRHFISSVHRILGYEYNMNQLIVGERLVRVDVFPMGIDYERFSNAAINPEILEEIRKLQKETQGRTVIVSVDRLDYTKGITHRLKAFHKFLIKHPNYREKVVFILIAVPSREEVEDYKQLKKQVDELIGQVNGDQGTIGWMPIWILHRSIPFNKMVALYSIADICLITPLRDGMNLVSKEFIATKTEGKGVLILSDMAGAAKELGEAIIINPNNINEIVNALEEAINMPAKEQIKRNKAMQERVKRYNITRWVEEFIVSLSEIKRVQKRMSAKVLSSSAENKLVNEYMKGNKRLLLFDFDGTLLPFLKNFSAVKLSKPIKALRQSLTKLASNKRNSLVLMSGRCREDLELLFGDIQLDIVAEHGVWLKVFGREWVIIESITDNWKEGIRPIMEYNVDRTPGTFIEEKDFSLVWHSRKAESELSLIRSRELIDRLIDQTQKLNLQVLECNKVIEVKNSAINKGKAALHWINKEKWDFILCIGDDWTDEDVYMVLTPGAYSMRVGMMPSKAQFNLEGLDDVINLLKTLSENNK